MTIRKQLMFCFCLLSALLVYHTHIIPFYAPPSRELPCLNFCSSPLEKKQTVVIDGLYNQQWKIHNIFLTRWKLGSPNPRLRDLPSCHILVWPQLCSHAPGERGFSQLAPRAVGGNHKMESPKVAAEWRLGTWGFQHLWPPGTWGFQD